MLSYLLLTSCVVIAQADTATDDFKLKQNVRKLVRQLDGETLAEREDAEKKLLELGAPVLSLLPAASDDQPAEMKTRLARIRLTLEKSQAEQFTGSKTISLVGEDLLLSKVLAEIQKQSGNKLLDYREKFGETADDPKIAVKFEKLPFWEALDQVFDRASLARYPTPEETGVAFQNRPDDAEPNSGRAAYNGPFRLEVTDVEAVRNLRRKEGGSMQIAVEIAWEPRLRPIALFQNPETISITDDQGKPVTMNLENAVQEIPITPGEPSTTLNLPLNPPPRSASKIASIKGKLEALVPGKIEVFRFTDLSGAKSVSQKKGGATVTLEKIRKNNAVWEIRVLVTFDQSSGALESHHLFVPDNLAYLETSDKQMVENAGLDLYRRDEEAVGVAYLFDIEGDLKKFTLVYETPVLILKTPIEYELKDIPLP